MPRIPPSLTCLAIAAALAGCSAIDRASAGIVGVVTPYKIEVVQGNFVSREQVQALRPGMSRQQVRDILGTPLVTSLFHSDRWDYVFTLKRQGVEEQKRRLTVFFKGEALERHEGDTMPTEAEFVATLENRRREVKVPVLEASEDKLRQFPAKTADPAAAAAQQPRPPAATYPPLEVPSR
ncbi:MAG: outer membrane protein assembly factor BamE [Burkholderiales bacterium]|nr:outer membrane protein assembly factor BamE [Burkholderiales bacterium]